MPARPFAKDPSKVRAAKLREERKRARRSPKLKPSNPIAPALARNGSLKCAVKSCGENRRGLGRYCASHAWTYLDTGHPQGRHVRRHMWRGFVREAERFVQEQLSAEHPAILAAIRWVANELRQAERPSSYNPAHLGYCDALLRAHRNGVDAVAFVGRWIAGELADDRGSEPGPRYVDDKHAVHQRARLYLLPRPFGPEPWARRKREQQPSPTSKRPSWGVRAYTFDRLNGALGVLALRAAAEIRRRQSNASHSATSTNQESTIHVQRL